MTDYPVITASETSSVEVPVVTETQTITYDRWWMQQFACNANDPNVPANAIAMMRKGRKLENGTWELSPSDSDVVYINLEDIFTLAETNVMAGQAIGLIIQLVTTQGVAQGKL